MDKFSQHFALLGLFDSFNVGTSRADELDNFISEMFFWFELEAKQSSQVFLFITNDNNIWKDGQGSIDLILN